MFKLFSKKKENEMAFLMDCVIEDCNDLLEDVDDLHASIEEGNKLLATVQQQCQEIIKIMEGHEPDEKTLDTYYVRDAEGNIKNIYTLAKLKDGNYVHIYDSLGTVDKVISINALVGIIAMDDRKLSQLFTEKEEYKGITFNPLYLSVTKKEADVEKISRQLCEDIQKRNEKRNYYIVKDDLGLVSKKFYIGEENGEEDKDVQGNRNIE